MNRLRWRGGLLPMLALFVLLLALLVLMSKATENAAHFGRLYSWFLLGSAAGLLLLGALLGRNIYLLVARYRRRVPGSRLTLRMAVLFGVIALVPVAVVYYFSYQLLNRSIDSWFDVRVDEGLEHALELSRAALGLRMREVLRQTQQMSQELVSVDQQLATLTLSGMLDRHEVRELVLFSSSGQIVTVVSLDPATIVPDYPPEGVLLHVSQGNDYVDLEPLPDGRFHIRALVGLPTLDPATGQYVLQALYPLPDRLGNLAESVQDALDAYNQLLFVRQPLRTSFILTLSLVLLFGVLAAVWSALYTAKRLVAPIRDLAEGTRAVAAGRYDRELPLPGSDELGFLVYSFNQMMRNLAQAWDASERSQRLLERERAYLEVVLARLSSGVMTLDHQGALRTHNQAAAQILRVDLDNCRGRPLGELGAEHGHLAPFCQLVLAALASQGDWRQELTLFSGGGRQVLMCRGSALPDPLGLKGGHVIVFDDITTLVQAERDAAWAEVARRLAHEIKNPLTPIQLSAERIRHKCLPVLEGDPARILERGTHTIVQQVQAMKVMVNEFNDYARPTQLKRVPVSLNRLINEVLYLYGDYPTGVEIVLQQDDVDPVVEADPGRLRQLVHNLVKNAIESIQDGQGSTLTIGTCCRIEADGRVVELTFRDDGPGFPADRLNDLLEPYVTTKPKGSGLGLAIVKKIVDEHGGVIHLESLPEGGALILVRLPASNAPAPPAPDDPSALSSTEESG